MVHELPFYLDLLRSLNSGTTLAALIPDDKAQKYFAEDFLLGVVNCILMVRKFKRESVLTLAEDCLFATMQLLLTQEAIPLAYPKSLEVCRFMTELYRKFFSLNRQQDPAPRSPVLAPEALEVFLAGLESDQSVDLLKVDEDERRALWCRGTVLEVGFSLAVQYLDEEEARVISKHGHEIAPLGLMSSQEAWRE